MNITIQQIESDIKVPMNDFDGKVVYGEKRAGQGNAYQENEFLIDNNISFNLLVKLCTSAIKKIVDIDKTLFFVVVLYDYRIELRRSRPRNGSGSCRVSSPRIASATHLSEKTSNCSVKTETNLTINCFFFFFVTLTKLHISSKAYSISCFFYQ